jgi:uncharacterized membrane protein
MTNKITISLISFLFAFLSINNASANLSIEEYIKSFDSSIVINGNGTIDVYEKIAYDFGPNERHGIERIIPIIKTNQEGKKFKLDFIDIRVKDQKFTKTFKQGKLYIKIGDPNKTIQGRQEYEISYRVLGALTYFSDHDELYWNITGTDWEVPIEHAAGEVNILGNSEVDNIQLACYSGQLDSRDQGCTIQTTAANKVEFSTTKALGINEGLSVTTGFPKGIVAILEPKPYYGDILTKVFYIVLAVLSYMFIFWVLYRWYKEWSNTRNKQKIVAAWYEPPELADGKKLSPAETAALVTKNVSHKSLTATLIHLAQRGFLKIDATNPKNVTLIKKMNWDETSVNNFEKTVLDALFNSGAKDSVSFGELKKSYTLASKLQGIYNTMLDNLYVHKFVEQKPSTYKMVVGSLLFVALILSMPLFGFPFAIIALLLKNASIGKTDVGIEKYSEAKSLLNFLKSQEEQLDFQADKQMFFEKLLPYATAFGVEKIWAKRFSDLQFHKSEWYEGSGTSSLNFVSSLNNMSRSFNSITSTTSSSGFGSGLSGGSSGRGGGGGGGRSW